MRIAPPVAIGPLSPGDLAGVQALIANATSTDGAPPLNEAALTQLGSNDPGLTHAVAHDKYGKVTGYLQVDRSGPHATAQLVVDPTSRRRGIGRMLVLLAARDATLPQVGGPQGARGKHLVLTAPHGSDTAASFAAALGYQPSDPRNQGAATYYQTPDDAMSAISKRS